MHNGLKQGKKTIELYKIAEEKGISVDYLKIPNNKSFSVSYRDDYFIAIDSNVIENSAQERTCLAHEIGHCETGSFYNMNSPLDIRTKHELRADKWAIKKLIPKNELNRSIRQGFYEVWQLAELFNVTEELMKKALYVYFQLEAV